ncbi:MAG: hypothetical protein SPE06_02955 [[Actinobacillus] rossii]|nr:hypothetical protein [[Actinobacillus] rossii]MDY4505364.1 hypothetical protein [[Actinobacillus] rossii]
MLNFIKNMFSVGIKFFLAMLFITVLVFGVFSVVFNVGLNIILIAIACYISLLIGALVVAYIRFRMESPTRIEENSVKYVIIN